MEEHYCEACNFIHVFGFPNIVTLFLLLFYGLYQKLHAFVGG